MAKSRALKASKASRRTAPPALETPTDFAAKTVDEVAEALNGLVADHFALYVKTKNFHWHMSGPHFRDYHLLLDEQGAQIFAAIDPLAERVRKLGGGTLRSIGQIAKLTTVKDNNAAYVKPADMLAELLADNKALAAAMRAAHDICDDHDDVASESLLENYIDEAERRVWFLFEAGRPADRHGH